MTQLSHACLPRVHVHTPSDIELTPFSKQDLKHLLNMTAEAAFYRTLFQSSQRRRGEGALNEQL